MPEQRIHFAVIGHEVYINLTGDGGGNIHTTFKEDEEEKRTFDEEDPHDYNCAMDGIESLILAHACAGLDVTSPAYVEGLQTALQACGNNF